MLFVYPLLQTWQFETTTTVNVASSNVFTPNLAKTRQQRLSTYIEEYSDTDKSLALPTSWCILFDGENISFDASLVLYINSTNIPAIMIINRIYEHQNLLSL